MPLFSSRTVRLAVLLTLASMTPTGWAQAPVAARPRQARPPVAAPAIQEDFFIQAQGLSTQRQGGSTVDLFLAVSYEAGTNWRPGDLQYPDYRLLLKLTQPLKEPTPAYPAQMQWEELAKAMVNLLLAEPRIDGAAVQLRVHPTCSVKPDDTGPRGFWRAAMASGGDAPVLAFVPSLERSTCQQIGR